MRGQSCTWLATLGVVATTCLAGRAEGPAGPEPPGHDDPAVVAVRLTSAEPDTEDVSLIRELQTALSESTDGDIEFLAFYGLTAKTFAERVIPAEPMDAKDVTAVLEIQVADRAFPEGSVAIEVFHYRFPAMPAPHVGSPEYTFKFGSLSALLAIHLHRSLSQPEAGPEAPRPAIRIRPASTANPYLPRRLLRRTVRLALASAAVGTPASRATFVQNLRAAVNGLCEDRGSYVMGVLPERALKHADPPNVEIRVARYRYPTTAPATQEARDEQSKDLSSPNVAGPFPSGLYYVAHLEPLSAYTLKFVDVSKSTDDLWRELDEAPFLTSSLEGVVRTVPGTSSQHVGLESTDASTFRAITPADELDHVIEGATVFDGSRSNPRFVADVGLAGERIAAIGDLGPRPRKATIDGSGLFLMPGFIDIHSHADSNVLSVPYAPSHIRQGITTVLAGNCSFSPLGIGSFLAQVARKGSAVNIGVLIGNRPVRKRVMGTRKGQPSYEELYRQKELVDLAMEEGAFGLSSGLIYSVSEEAFAWELAELAKQAEPYGGFYASHVRGETDEVLDAIREAIHIGEIAGVPVQISHMKVINRRNWGSMTRYVEIMEDARARGLDVTGDQYPWRASGPAAHYTLHKLLVREAIRAGTPEVVLLKDMPGKYAKYSGKLLTELLDSESMTPEELMADLSLTEKSQVYATYLCLGDHDVRLAMKEDFVMVCTDASMASLEAIESGKIRNEHPRKFRTYPEFFARYVRDGHVCSWELAVYKCTGLPATRLKLADRGMIKPGAFADVVLLDPEALDPVADYRDQTAAPRGIRWVFLNGRPVLKQGQLTRTRAGKALHAYGNIMP